MQGPLTGSDCSMQVIGSDTLKGRMGKPVKVAESDGDVSHNGIASLFHSACSHIHFISICKVNSIQCQSYLRMEMQRLNSSFCTASVYSTEKVTSAFKANITFLPCSK